MKLKSFFLTAAFLFEGAICLAGQSMRVTPLSGDPALFNFEDHPEISFSGTSLKIKTVSASNPVTFELDNIASIDFPEGSEVVVLKKSAISLTSDGEGFHFANVPEGSAALLVSASGATEMLRVEGGMVHVLRGNLQPGVYVIKINGFVTKIIL